MHHATTTKKIKSIQQLQNKFTFLQKRIDDAIYMQVRLKKEKLAPVSTQKRLIDLINKQMEEKKHQLKTLVSHLQSIDPKNLIKKVSIPFKCAAP